MSRIIEEAEAIAAQAEKNAGALPGVVHSLPHDMSFRDALQRITDQERIATRRELAAIYGLVVVIVVSLVLVILRWIPWWASVAAYSTLLTWYLWKESRQ